MGMWDPMNIEYYRIGRNAMCTFSTTGLAYAMWDLPRQREKLPIP
jgi:hypothetical protein